MDGGSLLTEAAGQMCEVLRTETEVECKIYSEDSQIIENYPTI